MGSFLWGGSKTKSKKKESTEGAEIAMDSDQLEAPNPVAFNNMASNQNLTPTSSMSPWPVSRPLDMRNSHVDIDLMRG